MRVGAPASASTQQQRRYTALSQLMVSLCRYASTWNGTVFRISLDSSLSLATTTAGVLYSQPDVYPLAASPIDSLGVPPPSFTMNL